MQPPGPTLAQTSLGLVPGKIGALAANPEQIGDASVFRSRQDERVGNKDVASKVVGLRLSINRVLSMLQPNMADLVCPGETRTKVLCADTIIENDASLVEVCRPNVERIIGGRPCKRSLVLGQRRVLYQLNPQPFCEVLNAHGIMTDSEVLQQPHDFNLDLNLSCTSQQIRRHPYRLEMMALMSWSRCSSERRLALRAMS